VSDHLRRLGDRFMTVADKTWTAAKSMQIGLGIVVTLITVVSSVGYVFWRFGAYERDSMIHDARLIAHDVAIKALQDKAPDLAAMQLSIRVDENRITALEALLGHEMRDLSAAVAGLTSQATELKERIGVVGRRSEESDKELRQGQDALMKALMDTHQGRGAR